MYKDEINNLKSMKRESYKIILKDLLCLYFKLKIGYPTFVKEREIIKYIIKFYIDYDKKELDILNEIKEKFGYINYNVVLENILDELDVIYNYYYEYIDNVINIYEQAVDSNLFNLLISRINGKTLNINQDNYKLIIPKLDKILDKEIILEKIRSK